MEKEPTKAVEDDQEDEWVGPTTAEMTQPPTKKRKVLQHEKLFLDKYVNKFFFKFYIYLTTKFNIT